MVTGLAKDKPIALCGGAVLRVKLPFFLIVMEPEDVGGWVRVARAGPPAEPAARRKEFPLWVRALRS